MEWNEKDKHAKMEEKAIAGNQHLPWISQMLNILVQYGLQSGLLGPLGIRREIEALKHVTAVRTNLGDLDFYNVSKHRWNPINDHGTSHLAVVDEERNAVSLTTTVNKFIGSQIISPGTGIVLNNEMDDSSINSHQHQPISLGLGKGHYHPSLLLLSLTSIFILISHLNSKMYY
ncbi:unnamed protein product [Citrullus colocynthis]|uniref:Uncharacterized protein n=1 Tax=Citrullus colocynthis TaxID=252529 RepID=A0ABP0Y6C9_9ROSI